VTRRAADRLLADVERSTLGTVTDIDQFMLNAALEVVGEFLFGSDLSDDANRITGATLEALEIVIKRARVPLSPPRSIPTPGNRVLKRSLRTLDSAVSSIVRSRNGIDTGVSPETFSNLVDLLLFAREDTKIDLDGIRDEM